MTRRSEAAAENGATCRFCGAGLHHIFVDLGRSPLCQTHLQAHQLNEMEPFYPLRVFICEEDFLVQLPEHVSPQEIFTEYAYFSSYSDSWLAHAKAYAEEAIRQFALGRDSLVVKLGSHDGYLLQNFVRRRIPALGIEPALNMAAAARQKGVPTIPRFFGSALAEGLAGVGKRANLLIANNVLAQIPSLNDFIREMKTLLAPRGVITAEFPHLLRMVERNEFDTIYHEHFSYFSFLTVEKIFAAHGLVLFDVEELPTHGGSLRIYGRHAEDTTKPIGPRVSELRHREVAAGLTRLEYYASFADRVHDTKRRLLDLLIDIKGRGQTIAGYGAPGKGNTLLNYCGIRTDFLDYLVDRNPYKQNKFTPGTHIPIFAPDKIRETEPDYVLILPWNLEEEIRNQLSFIREWGGKFIVPIPTPRVVP